MLTLLAPAKLNLTLEVLGKRDDGYHEIRSVVQTIGPCDRLRFRASQQTEYSSSMPEWVPQQSLVPRAVDLLREATGHTGGVGIEVDKQVPLMSGLGGDSSDAAAVLRGLNRLWELGLAREELQDLASRLGSDVPLFLLGGTVLMEGRGERVSPLPPLPAMWVVLVLPEVPREPGKTRHAYASLEAGDYTDGRTTSRLVEVLETGQGFVPSLLFNAFERAVFAGSARLATCREQMSATGASNAHLAGSGPALFALVEEQAAAEEINRRLRQQGLVTHLAQTLAARQMMA